MRSEQVNGDWSRKILISYRKPDELVDLITTSRTVLSSFAKAKTAKLGTQKESTVNPSQSNRLLTHFVLSPTTA
jgi:hypothetical protein